jgi:hypothetical protein
VSCILVSRRTCEQRFRIVRTCVAMHWAMGCGHTQRSRDEDENEDESDDCVQLR